MDVFPYATKLWFYRVPIPLVNFFYYQIQISCSVVASRPSALNESCSRHECMAHHKNLILLPRLRWLDPAPARRMRVAPATNAWFHARTQFDFHVFCGWIPLQRNEWRLLPPRMHPRMRVAPAKNALLAARTQFNFNFSSDTDNLPYLPMLHFGFGYGMASWSETTFDRRDSVWIQTNPYSSMERRHYFREKCWGDKLCFFFFIYMSSAKSSISQKKHQSVKCQLSIFYSNLY